MSGAEEETEYSRFLKLIAEHLTRAEEVRKTLSLKDFAVETDSPESLIGNLRRARAVVDNLEYILCAVLVLKTKADRFKAAASDAVEDAEVAVADPGTRQDYVTARDRNIAVNAMTITQRRALRKATVLAVEAAAAVDIVRTMHRGADSHRRDIETRLRAVTLITTLER